MIALQRNKQKMKYAVPLRKVPKYERDEEGNILYEGYEDEEGNFIFILDSEGNKIPRDTGELETEYGQPTGFKGYIGSQLEDAITRAWGSDNSNNFAVLVLSKHAKDENGEFIAFPNGTLIWRLNEPTVAFDNAEYIVDGVMDEELNESAYYLRKQR